MTKKPSRAASKKSTPPEMRLAFLNKIPGVKRYRLWLRARARWQRVILYIVFSIVAIFVLHNVIERSWRPVKNPTYGLSFSVKYSQELGLNWRENYIALLDDLDFDALRLKSYWDLHEPENDVYRFEDLDWQMDEAAKRGMTVSLAIGLRQPRWPECHQPGWARELGNNTPHGKTNSMNISWSS